MHGIHRIKEASAVAATRRQAVIGFLLATLVASVAGSLAQTQFNLLSLVELGVTIPPMLWLRTMGEDVIYFAPVYAVVVMIALFPAFAVAGLLSRVLPAWRRLLLSLAGGAGILTAILSMNALLPMTPLAATRETAGIAALVAAGALGGWVHAQVTGIGRADGRS